tara:strand:- start:132 stop:296 length:165 start_codon:yes stop_codon:yes gene_type:complete
MSAGEKSPAPNSAKTMWIGVGVVFGLMALAWYFLFTIAADNPVESVPLEHHPQP